MFIDEGFGSLDEESLQAAMQTLAELSLGNRLVGIISHVNLLKEQIDDFVILQIHHILSVTTIKYGFERKYLTKFENILSQ